MKKGYLCPHCGNSETGRMEVFSDGCPSLPLLQITQKILRRPDAKVSCMDCGWLSETAGFRARRRWNYGDLR